MNVRDSHSALLAILSVLKEHDGRCLDTLYDRLIVAEALMAGLRHMSDTARQTATEAPARPPSASGEGE